MIKTKSSAGPNPYVAGTGLTITFGEFEKVDKVIVVCDREQVLETADYIYSIHSTIGATPATANQVKIQVYEATTVGAGPNAWGECAAGNMSGRTFTVIADGY